MKAKYLVPVSVLMLLCAAATAAAQPTCFFNDSISSPCPPIYGDIIFVGRVVSLTDLRRSDDAPPPEERAEVNILNGLLEGRARVAVETLLKGEAEGEMEIAFGVGCWGTIKTGERYVFNIQRTPDGLRALKWTEELNLSRENDARFLEMIRSLIVGERQPRLIGTIHHAGRPVSNVIIIAEKDGERFETRTGANGRYEFRELPEGDYRVYPILPSSLRPPDDHGGQPRDQYENRVRVMDESLCGARADFVAIDNGVIRGRVENADGQPMNHVNIILLWLVDKNTRQSAPYPARTVMEPTRGEFAFANLPPGPYLLEVTAEGRDGRLISLYYPGGASSEDEARPVNLAAGQQIANLVIRFPR